MNLSKYIAFRISGSSQQKQNYSKPVVKIGILSIVLSLSIMLVAISVVNGFKKAITEKLSSIASDITVTKFDNNSSLETKPIVYSEGFVNYVQQKSEVKSISPYVLKHAIVKTEHDLQGIIVKGVTNFEVDNKSIRLLEGDNLKFDSQESNEVLVTEIMSKYLNLKVGDSLFVLYIAQPQRELTSKIMKNDANSVFYSTIPKDSMRNNRAEFYTYNKKVFDFYEYLQKDSMTPIAPRRVVLRVKGIFETGLYELDQKLVIAPIAQVQEMYNWTKQDISGYEIHLHHFDDLMSVQKEIQQYSPELYASDIKSNYPEIFDWFPSIDVNGIVIITLMILVSVMAMISTLLILIMEKTELIGVLKAMGMNNWGVKKIFFWNAAIIIFKGMIIGNIIGIGLLLIQDYFHIFSLDQKNYYLSYIPVDINWLHFFIINVGTFLICMIALIIPSIAISQISPIKAIRFE